MATLRQFKEDLTDKIIKKIFEEYSDFDPDYYRKKINPITGTISTDSDDGNTVLYQEDYQEAETAFDSFLETISTCMCNTHFNYNDEGQTVCEDDDFTLVDYDNQVRFAYTDQTSGYNSQGGEEWEMDFPIIGCGTDIDMMEMLIQRKKVMIFIIVFLLTRLF